MFLTQLVDLFALDTARFLIAVDTGVAEFLAAMALCVVLSSRSMFIPAYGELVDSVVLKLEFIECSGAFLKADEK